MLLLVGFRHAGHVSHQREQSPWKGTGLVRLQQDLEVLEAVATGQELGRSGQLLPVQLSDPGT